MEAHVGIYARIIRASVHEDIIYTLAAHPENTNFIIPIALISDIVIDTRLNFLGSNSQFTKHL